MKIGRAPIKKKCIGCGEKFETCYVNGKVCSSSCKKKIATRTANQKWADKERSKKPATIVSANFGRTYPVRSFQRINY